MNRGLQRSSAEVSNKLYFVVSFVQGRGEFPEPLVIFDMRPVAQRTKEMY